MAHRCQGPGAQAISLHDRHPDSPQRPALLRRCPPRVRERRAAVARGVRRHGAQPAPAARRSRPVRPRAGDRRGRADPAPARQRHVRPDLGSDAAAPAGPPDPRLRPAGLRAQRSARLRRALAAAARRRPGRLDARRARARARHRRRHLPRRDVGAVHGARAARAGPLRRRPRHPRRLARGHARRPLLPRDDHPGRPGPGRPRAGAEDGQGHAPRLDQGDGPPRGLPSARQLLRAHARDDGDAGLAARDVLAPQPRDALRPPAAPRTSSATTSCARSSCPSASSSATTTSTAAPRSAAAPSR